ncbi:MAG: HIT domain-containing protein [Ectothiorhodospiraceae bacterium]|nr:HIT domain-containing protein [Ectothiorhodospiraceae bacterium]
MTLTINQKLILDDRLTDSTYPLADMPLHGYDDNILLLSKNALFPWFILVPSTQETEFHKLSTDQQSQTQQHINTIARFIEMHFSPDKINIATIGNIVSQMHIHIIGRRKDDSCWPNVVWGSKQYKDYEAGEVTTIKNQLSEILKPL